jgi:uncharacterized membrane protein YcaP (DUF421 family)
MTWVELFAIHVSPLELVLRGTVVYWFLFLVLRFLLHRDLGSMGVSDVLFLVLIADASQSGMVGESRTVSEALIVVSTIVFWNWVLDWAAFNFEPIAHLVSPPSMVLVRRGRVLRHNLEREWISLDELKAKLRQHGVERLRDVKIARMEADGQISVIRYAGGTAGPPAPDGARPGAR